MYTKDMKFSKVAGAITHVIGWLCFMLIVATIAIYMIHGGSICKAEIKTNGQCTRGTEILYRYKVSPESEIRHGYVWRYSPSGDYVLINGKDNWVKVADIVIVEVIGE